MNAVIKPWLSAGLIVALAANALFSAVLILNLSRFDEAKQQARDSEDRIATNRTELARLQVEVGTLTEKKDTLAATVTDWQQRLKEKTAAEAGSSHAGRQAAAGGIRYGTGHQALGRNQNQFDRSRQEEDRTLSRRRATQGGA